MKKYLLLLSLLLSLKATAQHRHHALSLHAGAGLQGLHYTLSDPDARHTHRPGYTLGLGYGYFFTPHWGVRLGVGLSAHRSQSTAAQGQSSYDALDTDGDRFIMMVDASSLAESQSALFVDLPLTARYQLALSPRWELQAGAGVQISLAAQAKYVVNEGTVTTTGYYPQYDWLAQDLPAHGFTTVNLAGHTARLPLTPAFSGLVDLGVGYALGSRCLLSAGLYVRMGFNTINDVPQSTSGSIVQTAQETNTYTGMFSTAGISAVKPVALGLQVGMTVYLD
jgi:hypothetical protein